MQKLALLARPARRVLALLTAAALAACKAGPPPTRYTCDDPAALTIAGKETGYLLCSGGGIVRDKAQTCPNRLPRAVMCKNIVTPGESQENCSTDADCTSYPNGFCESHGGLCQCSYGCVRDYECGSGRICVCDEPAGHCQAALCISSADCVDGAMCARGPLITGCATSGFFTCRGEHHECSSDADCSVGNRCEDKDGYSICTLACSR